MVCRGEVSDSVSVSWCQVELHDVPGKLLDLKVPSNLDVRRRGSTFFVVARWILEHLGHVGAYTLADQFFHDCALVRSRAEGSLDRMGDVGVHVVLRLVRHTDAVIQARALASLSRMGPQGAAALSKLLRDRDPRMRLQASGALLEAGSESFKHTDGLLAQLEDSNPEVRQHIFAELLSRRQQMTPHLVAGLQNPSPTVRRSCAELLGLMGEESLSQVDSLLANLGDEDADAWKFSAQAIGRMGPAGASALASQLRSGRDGRGEVCVPPFVRMRAEEALRWLGRGGARALAAKTEDQDASVRLHAVRALGRLGEAARPDQGPLLRRLGDSHPQVRRLAAETLARPIGGGVLQGLSLHPALEARDLVREVLSNAAQSSSGSRPRKRWVAPLLPEKSVTPEIP